MDLLLVRHGESEANAEGRMQGSLDSPLTALGRAQAERLGKWLKASGLSFQAAYCSPLSRARETAELVCAELGQSLEQDPDLQEIHSGALQGLDAAMIAERYPSFLKREITTLGDFEEYGGESYAEVQARVARVLERLDTRHKRPPDATPERVLVVAHGGIIFQMVKALICRPVPQVAVFRYGNCTSTLVRMRERRGAWMGEVRWHMPIELLGGEARDPVVSVFR